MAPAARTIVYDQLFEDDLAALGPNVRRLDEACRYLEWILARRPEVGLTTDYPGVLRAPLKLPQRDGTTLQATAFYVYDAERVYLLRLKVRPSPG